MKKQVRLEFDVISTDFVDVIVDAPIGASNKDIADLAIDKFNKQEEDFDFYSSDDVHTSLSYTDRWNWLIEDIDDDYGLKLKDENISPKNIARQYTATEKLSILRKHYVDDDNDNFSLYKQIENFLLSLEPDDKTSSNKEIDNMVALHKFETAKRRT